MKGDGHSEGNDANSRFRDYPEALQRLADTMIGIDPSWCIEDWLQSKAEEDLDILSVDFERARLQAEQQLYRIDSLSQRLDPEEKHNQNPAQRNLFDCFDDIVKRGLANAESGRIVGSSEERDSEPHPASYLTNLLPGLESDDPLLAITAQAILIEINNITQSGMDFAPLEFIVGSMFERGIAAEEIEEAIDHLLMQGEIHEVDDDCFVVD